MGSTVVLCFSNVVKQPRPVVPIWMKEVARKFLAPIVTAFLEARFSPFHNRMCKDARTTLHQDTRSILFVYFLAFLLLTSSLLLHHSKTTTLCNKLQALFLPAS